MTEEIKSAMMAQAIKTHGNNIFPVAGAHGDWDRCFLVPDDPDDFIQFAYNDKAGSTFYVFHNGQDIITF